MNGGDTRGSVEGHPCWIKEADLLGLVDFRYQYMLHDYLEHRKHHDTQEYCGALVKELKEKNL